MLERSNVKKHAVEDGLGVLQGSPVFDSWQMNALLLLLQ